MQLNYTYRPIKLILFPRFTTLWDLFILINNTLKESSTGILELKKLSNDSKIRLLQLALAHMYPLADRLPDKIIIREKNVEKWLQTTYLTLETLIHTNDFNTAKAYALEFMSTFFFLITSYVVQRVEKNKEATSIIGKIELEDKSLKHLISIFDSNDWKGILQSIEMHQLFMMVARFYSLSIREMLNSVDEDVKKDLLRQLSAFINLSSHIDEIIPAYKAFINDLTKNPDSLTIRAFLSSLIIFVEGLIRHFLRENNNEILSHMKSILGKIEEMKLSEFLIDYSDISVSGLETIVGILNALMTNNINDAVDKLRTFGSMLFDEKKKLIGVTERLMLKLPPEVFSIPPPFVPPPIELRDRLSSSSLLMVVNEALEEVVSSSLERKNLLKTLLIMKPKLFKRFLFLSITDPLASFALMFLIGLPSVFLFETIIAISTQSKNKHTSKLEEIIEILVLLLRTEKEITRYMERKYDQKRSFYGPLVAFYLYRDVFFISLIMTDKIKRELGKLKMGRILISEIEEIYKYLERLYGGMLPIKREDISELFA